jgi:hypothetical protein
MIVKPSEPSRKVVPVSSRVVLSVTSLTVSNRTGKDAVRSLENIQVRDLMKLLGRVKGRPAKGSDDRAA